MGEHGYYQKTTLFQNATHVPLIISVPGMKTAGQVAGGPVEMVDFYPTLVELAGLPRPKHLSGVSLVPTLRQADRSVRREALTQLGEGYSIRTDRYRYTEWGESGRQGKELYDHMSDPEEMANLAGRPEMADIESELAGRLRARVEEARAKPPGVRQLKPVP